MTYEEIEELAGHRHVPAWVVKLVGDAVAIEREACAKVAEERLIDKANCTAEQMYEMQKKSIAEDIRARGQV
jgi:hypothetical protein